MKIFVPSELVSGISAKAQGGKFIDGVKGAGIGLSISAAMQWGIEFLELEPDGDYDAVRDRCKEKGFMSMAWSYFIYRFARKNLENFEKYKNVTVGEFRF